ncbi:helix-turn-helix domain-containing protein [Beduinella massiliensis]|uniref:helix-turn-helix domain-containing protein n=1 Tax=Beduinella massiliensis TaxID=1852363 RepID=UPI000C853F2F
MARRLKQDISIGQNLQKLRIAAGLTQEAVVAKLTLMQVPISREILSQMEAGRYSIRISVLLALSEVYDVEIEEFFTGVSWRDLPSDSSKEN